MNGECGRDKAVASVWPESNAAFRRCGCEDRLRESKIATQAAAMDNVRASPDGTLGRDAAEIDSYFAATWTGGNHVETNYN